MEVILTESVDGLGDVGAHVKVKPGFGRNYLLPRRLAVVANSSNVREFEHHKRQLEHKALAIAKDSESMKVKIEAQKCEFTLRASEDGKLFGSVTSADIADKLAAANIVVDRKKIQLGEPIKALGEHSIDIKLPGNVVATVGISVVSAE
ncbi:MAG: 50S ribosomal protein L9 [Desulfuromonadaceae bacterium]|jgi:large subunit ribosomal protein L9|nr:50S ribosomal protein L9 [Desulfuromonas sp.]MDY0185706.1 50S ribosomal protein L9 [Desulfuromonadaceae bacterium]